MSRNEIFEKVREALVDALAVDDDEVTPDAKIMADLGAESIDVLDIQFKLEQTFGFKIAQGEMFPDNVLQDADYVQDGKLTDKGLDELKARLGHLDFGPVEADRSVEKVADMFTVDALVSFCEQKLQTA